MESIDRSARHSTFLSDLVFRGGLIVLWWIFCSGVAQAYGPNDPSTVANVRFRLDQGTVVVSYNFRGSFERLFRVSLLLRRGSDSTYEYEPKAVAGDIGVIRASGGERQIVWNIGSEFPQGLQGSDFYFVVHAAEIEEESGPGLLTVVGAGVAVLAAAGTYFLVHGSHGQATKPPAFPAPPGRPQ